MIGEGNNTRDWQHPPATKRLERVRAIHHEMTQGELDAESANQIEAKIDELSSQPLTPEQDITLDVKEGKDL